jgi:peptidyl-prolyl cis-trans isomerase D
MLDVLRRGASTWISKLLLSVLIVSFGVWGIGDMFRGFGSTVAFRIGSRTIELPELDQTYEHELRTWSGRVGRNLTRDDALKNGLSGQILSKIVTDATLAEAAHTLRLGVSDETIRTMIVSDPMFKGPDGAFDRTRFVELLRANGWNEDLYVMRRRADTLSSQLIDGISGGMEAPKAWVEALDLWRNETRSVRWIALAPAAPDSIAAPSADDLAKFYEQRKAAFRAQETRGFVALVLDADSIADPSLITDDDARIEYNRQKSRFVVPEKRRVLQILFDDEASAKAAAERIAQGTPFETIAAERGLKPEDTDLGLLTKSAFVDPAVADAAFGVAEVGGVSAPVAGRIGPVLLKLAEKTGGGETPFAEAAPEIKREIARKRAQDDILSRHDQIEDAIAGGAKLAEIATRFGLKPVTVEAVLQNGTLPSGDKMPALPQQQKVLTGVFESDVGVENDTVDLGGKGFLWYVVTNVTPAHDRPLDEVRDRVLAAWRTEIDSKRLDEEAQKILARLKAGEDFEKVASDLGLTLTTSGEFKRDDRPDDLSAPAVAAAFEGGEGHVAVAAGKNDGRVVLQVAGITPPVFFAETDEAKAIAGEATQAIRTTYLESWLGKVQKDIGVTSNQQVIGRVIGTARK